MERQAQVVSLTPKTSPSDAAQSIDDRRLAAVKAAYSVRRVPLRVIRSLLPAPATPRPGDLVLARVDRIGQHQRIELASGRRAHLHVGDEILVSYANRYAPDQFEALVPDDLGQCDLVAAGGVAARCISRHSRMKRPTRITPLGLVADRSGKRVNLADWALPQAELPAERPHVVAVVGTAMNAGKTTTAASLIHGLSVQGHRVGAAKITGTGAGGDRWSMVDAGAIEAVDFTDAGYASTFKVPQREIEWILGTLVAHLAEQGATAIVLEVADGLLQQETAELLESELFRRAVDSIFFAAGDALGAGSGVAWLKARDLPVVAVSGLLTASELACREAEAVTGMPIIDKPALSAGAWRPGPRNPAQPATAVAEPRGARRAATPPEPCAEPLYAEAGAR